MREACENCESTAIREASIEAEIELHVCPDCRYCHICGGDEIDGHYDDCIGEL